MNQLDYQSLESDQRAADDMLINNLPHDCRQQELRGLDVGVEAWAGRS